MDPVILRSELRQANRVVTELEKMGSSRSGKIRFQLLARTRNGLLVRAHSVSLQLSLAYFPNLKHKKDALAFATTLPKLAAYGPGFYMPGAAYALNAEYTSGVHARAITVYTLQGLFKSNPTLPRSAITRHNGARNHLLNQLFTHAEEEAIPEIHLAVPYSGGGNKNTEIFEEIARRRGWKFSREQGHKVVSAFRK